MLKKFFRTIFLYKAQFISMIIMVFLGVGVFVGFQGEWYSIEKDTFAFYDESGFADYRLINEKGYSADDQEKISRISGVKKTSRFISVKTNESKDNDVISVAVTSDINVSGFIVTEGNAYDETILNGVWMSDRYALANGYGVGDGVELKYANIVINGIIRGLIKSSEYLICTPGENQMMPDYNTYGYVYVSPKTFYNAFGRDYYTEIRVISDLNKDEFKSAVNVALSRTDLILTKDEIVSYSEAQGEASEGKTMASILPVIFLCIAVLIMVTTMQRLMTNEKTQIGTLKALGFKDKRIIRHYALFGLFIGGAGSAIGIAFGYFVAWFIFNENGSMGTYFDLPSWKIYMPWWTFLVIAIVVAFMTFVSYLSVKNILRGTAADALKPYVPKTMKRLKIEDYRWWKNLKFATKWNLRDLFRHKARSAMTLFGVFGCTILMVASFLMMESMVGFVNKFYYESMNYESQISLKNDVSNDTARSIAERYNGDYAASVGVSLNGEAVSLDVYGIKKDKIRFLDEGMEYVKLSNDGVYLGQRLIESNGLKIGDKFKVYVFGSDISYEFTLIGGLRTLSKGVIMTENYAEKIGVQYLINNVYTDETVDSIISDAAFKESVSTLKSRNDIIKSFDSFMEVMYVMIGALIVLSVVLGIVVLYNLGTMSYFERYRELSTLKVVGYKDKKIGKLLITQNLWLTIVGFIVGFPSGILITKVLMNALAAEYEMTLIFGWMTFVIPLILIFGVSTLVSVAVARKNKKINMVEALKVPE